MITGKKINISIVEDVADIRNNLKEYLCTREEIGTISLFESMEDFLKETNSRNVPDVVFSDIGLPGMSGIEGIKIIKERYPETDVIMLTIFSDSAKIFQSLCSGATGYVLKGSPLPEIMKAVLEIRAGGSYMTPSIARKVIEYFVPEKKYEGELLTIKEKHIVEAMTEGLSYKLIADKLDVSIDTVRFHIKNIYRKLHVNSKAEVISKVYRGEI